MDRYRKKEVEPLLEQGLVFPSDKIKHSKKLYEEEEIDDDENFEDEIALVAEKKSRNVALHWQDFVLLTFDFLQLLAVIQSMAIRWSWSKNWLKSTYFIFLFNLDLWEFMKFQEGHFRAIKDYYVPTSGFSFQFWYLALIALVISLVLAAIFVALNIIFRVREVPKLLMKLARLRQVIFFLIQLLTLPIGTVIAHLFQCNDKNEVDVMNSLTCFSGFHWLYLSFGIVVYIICFFVFPGYIIFKARRESEGSCSKHHESFILLNETEFKVGLSKTWLVCDLYLFTSFKYYGLYQRAVHQIFKLPILIVMAVAMDTTSTQAWATFSLFVVYSFIYIVIRPYRLTFFNVFLVATFICLASLSLLGALQSQFDVYTLDNPWFLPQYSVWLLAFLVFSWLLLWAVFLTFLVIRKIKYKCLPHAAPLWPSYVTSPDDCLSFEARKFMKTFLRARFTLEKAKEWPVIFAPVHDLAKQIKILNAYCREAEYLGDALHGIMWNLLDEMIETHSDLSLRSLFAESVKENIHQTSRNFLELMPAFSKRVAQRDYDFILVNPVKKRLLLKMYCLAMFLKGRKEAINKTTLLTKPALDTIWTEPIVEDLEETGYYEDLYPDPHEVQSDSSVDVSMESSEEDEGEANFQKLYGDLPETEVILPDMFKEPSTIERMSSSRVSRSPEHRSPSAQSLLRPGSCNSNKSGISNQAFEDFPPGFIPTMEDRPPSSQTSSKVSVRSGIESHSSRPNTADQGGVNSGHALAPSPRFIPSPDENYSDSGRKKKDSGAKEKKRIKKTKGERERSRIKNQNLDVDADSRIDTGRGKQKKGSVEIENSSRKDDSRSKIDTGLGGRRPKGSPKPIAEEKPKMKQQGSKIDTGIRRKKKSPKKNVEPESTA